MDKYGILLDGPRTAKLAYICQYLEHMTPQEVMFMAVDTMFDKVKADEVNGGHE